MIFVCLIFCSLALIAAGASLWFAILERSRSNKRNTALCALVDRLSDRVDALEKGTVPDFEKAKAAAAAVNDFNAGITGILGFDPYEAIRKQRKENGGEIR